MFVGSDRATYEITNPEPLVRDPYLTKFVIRGDVPRPFTGGTEAGVSQLVEYLIIALVYHTIPVLYHTKKNTNFRSYNRRA